ncbi:unnamed protein product [Zymoseptoria tritici ST99CH_3D7]|uniref:C2H2-type domain-containing protein n=2 Tax=Zymoseptoria tritici TaxID=1047171 RepID=A0A1X7RLN0_ZYMT9|nr:unnamed protein product [Zymoseptoria tritici ST99CH_3D7]SMR48100.1 unnamed protein product [Zymoseptoria tritici ST99CH_1E4]
MAFNRGGPPPSASTLPQPQTDSARDARRAFFCDLCQKGYARSTDFEAHEGSYDHQHRKRLKEMRAMTKDPNAAAKQRLAESRSNASGGLKSVSIPLSVSSTINNTSTSGPVKKKPVFKSTLQPQNVAAVATLPGLAKSGGGGPVLAVSGGAVEGVMVSDWNLARANGWEGEVYDPNVDDGEDGEGKGWDVDFGALVREFAEVDERRERAKRG